MFCSKLKNKEWLDIYVILADSRRSFVYTTNTSQQWLVILIMSIRTKYYYGINKGSPMFHHISAFVEWVLIALSKTLNWIKESNHKLLLFCCCLPLSLLSPCIHFVLFVCILTKKFKFLKFLKIVLKIHSFQLFLQLIRFLF